MAKVPRSDRGLILESNDASLVAPQFEVFLDEGGGRRAVADAIRRAAETGQKQPVD